VGPKHRRRRSLFYNGGFFFPLPFRGATGLHPYPYHFARRRSPFSSPVFFDTYQATRRTFSFFVVFPAGSVSEGRASITVLPFFIFYFPGATHPPGPPLLETHPSSPPPLSKRWQISSIYLREVLLFFCRKHCLRTASAFGSFVGAGSFWLRCCFPPVLPSFFNPALFRLFRVAQRARPGPLLAFPQPTIRTPFAYRGLFFYASPPSAEAIGPFPLTMMRTIP